MNTTQQQVSLEKRKMDPCVPSTPADRFFDYCLQPYEPRCAPRDGLRGESLFWHSLHVAHATDDAYALALATQAHAGNDATVWGTKWIDGKLRWELYFYDPQRETPAVWASHLLPALRPYAASAPTLSDAVPYFMWSFDLLPEHTKTSSIDLLNVYLAEPTGQAGRSYKWTSTDCEYDNHYVFLPPKESIQEILYRIKSSVFVDFTKAPLQRILLPELLACRRVCVAKKRRADAIYYSGLSIAQLLWFFRRFSYPDAIFQFAQKHQQRTQHLSFDVGIDYRSTANGTAIEIMKTGYYSTF